MFHIVELQLLQITPALGYALALAVTLPAPGLHGSILLSYALLRGTS